MKKEFEKRLYSSFIIIPVSFFFLFQGSVFFIFFLSTLFIATSYEWTKMLKKKFLIKILGILFLIISFYSAYKFRNDIGLIPFILIILICIFTDLGGYIFGKFFKGPKLTKISPNKTYSGALGSIIFCSITISCLFLYVLKIFNLKILAFALITSFFCQLGDLIFSFLKRKAKLDDTGNFLPGHGGVLDRLDGIFLGLPAGLITLLLLAN